MAYYPYTKVHFSLLISFIIINLMMMTNASILHARVTEFFVSDLPQNTSPLQVHCQSQDDDLGVHTLKMNEKFDFSFHQNFWGITHFHYAFSWDLKNNNFDVFLNAKSLCRFNFFKQDIYCT
ncbi:hypothetical protein R3W88_005086 [Solanum pinnatisectum]|uniref:S-protein homolog n=1 Tax=Solanum pinnatisectum TaxID=50273 RepID=A0AAV9KB41_9SOLN|nr:hypothetical protein R3W88_005086 [Solanum pinnatisectum]